jgi:hypothetical protein
VRTADRGRTPSDGLSGGVGSELVVMSLLDREVNCRRAAAAAFQEHVGRCVPHSLAYSLHPHGLRWWGGGRQGSFAHGIEIVTQADFFSLGNRTRAYLEIAPAVAACALLPLVSLSLSFTSRLAHTARRQV